MSCDACKRAPDDGKRCWACKALAHSPPEPIGVKQRALPVTAAPELPEGSSWKPCAAGITDGRVLLVMCPEGLAIAAKSGLPRLHTVDLRMPELRSLLATQGLTIVDAKDRAVLEACAKLKPVPHLFTAGSGMSVADADRVMLAELARREKP